MKLKPRAARRLLLLGGVVLLVVVGGVAFVGVRSWQNERRSQQLRIDGMAAVASKDDYAAIDNLGRFLRRKPADREAWLAFAQARERVEEPGGQHLQQALLGYSRAYALDQTDNATARKMLALQNNIGLFPEARDLAIRLRPAEPAQAGPDLADVLREEATARLGLKAYDGVLDQVTSRLVALDPAGYQPAALRMSYLLSAARNADAVAFAAAQVAVRPSDPRALMLQQMALISTGAQTNGAEFLSVVCKAAGLESTRPARVAESTYTEADFAFQLVQSFDRLGMPLHSLMVLKDAVTRLKNEDAKRLLARRTWQAQLAGELIEGPAGPGADPAALHAEVLGFIGLAYRDIGEAAKAKSTLAILQSRNRSAIAQNWVSLLTALIEKTDARESLSLVDAALKAEPNNPIFVYFKAEMLGRLGRADEARQLWAGLYKSPAADGWAAPAVRAAETLIDEGRLDEGLAAAIEAIRRSRTSPAASLVLLRAQTALIESGRSPADPAAALAELEALMARLASAEQAPVVAAIDSLVLPARIELLCAVGRKAEAVQTLEAALAKPGAVTPDLIMRLSAVSARAKLGMEDRLFASTVSADGSADPNTLFTRVLLLSSANKRDEAVGLLDQALASAKPDSKLQVEIVRCQFFDATGDAQALATWKKLVADHPDSLAALSAVVRSNASCADLLFIDAVIAKLTALGGSDPDRPSAIVRLARCRALLFGAPTAKHRDEAIALLRAMMLEAPRLEARNLLIEAFLMDDPGQNIKPDFAAAAEQLTAASAVAPNRAPYTLRLASVLQRQGRARDAASELSKLALDKAASRAERLQAIDRLSGLLENETALRGVDGLIAETKEPAVGLLARRAVLLSTLGRDREAAAAYRLVLDRPSDDLDALLTAAAGLRALGENAAADEAVKKLEQSSLAPSLKTIGLGRLAVASGQFDVARTHFTRATEIAPDDARTWAALAQFLLQRGEMAAAEAAANAGLVRIPANPDLAVLLQQSKLAGQSDATADLSALAAALDKTPGMQRRAAAIRSIEKSQRDGKFDDVATLMQLSDEFADDSTTQLFVSRRLTALKPPRLAEAATLMRRAANRFPGDASVQEQATRILAGVGDWQTALVSAMAWRTLTRSPQADLAVGESHLMLGRPRPAFEAVTAIRLPAPPTIAPDDSVSLGALSVRVRGLAGLATVPDTKAAFQTLQPYLPSAAVRSSIGLPVASQIVTPLEEARRWIEQIAAAAKPDDRDEQLAVAGAWARLATRFPAAKKELFTKAIVITDTLIASEATADATVFESRAELLAATGDTAGAIAAARAAIAKQPDIVSARLGLANLLLGTAEGGAEAASLAQKAAELNPASPEPLLVLCRVQLQQADIRTAAGDAAGRDAAKRDAASTLKKLLALKPVDFGLLNDLAIMAERIDDPATAVSLYEQAIASPQAPAGRNLAIAKNNLAFTLLQQSIASGNKAPLARAKQLVSESIQVEPLPSFYDTLGSINAAMGDRPGALSAYRRCLTDDPRSYTTVVGLAMLLADGTTDEKAEATALVKRIDDAPDAVKSLSTLRRQQLTDLRPKLAPR